MISSQKNFQPNRSFLRPPQFLLKFGSDPFKGENKNFLIMGFMVFKLTCLDSRFQCKNRFWKICTESRDIGQNVSNFAGLVWMAGFRQFFGNILGLGAYFSKPIFALKSWVQAGRFEYHEPHILNNFFFTFKGVGSELKNHKIARHSAGNALKFPIFFSLHSYYPNVCANSTPWSN